MATPDASPNEEVRLVAPAKAEEPKVAPEGAKEKLPAAGDPAASTDGLGSAAPAADGASPLPAQQQLW